MTDEERLAARSAVSPHLALLERLSILEGEIPGAAAYQAAKHLLEHGEPSSATVSRLGQRDATGAWSVDHAAAMRLWSPDDGTGVPPREMLDAFLDSYAERTGDDGERPLIERLYAETESAEAEKAEADGAKPAPPSTVADAKAVADRYGYGAFVDTVELPSTRRGSGFFARRKIAPAGPRLFLFESGIVIGADGALDAYVWSDLELIDTTVVSDTGIEYRPVPRKTLLLGPIGRSTQFAIPSMHRGMVLDLAGTGGATIR